jgi:hypothetical protein
MNIGPGLNKTMHCPRYGSIEKEAASDPNAKSQSHAELYRGINESVWPIREGRCIVSSVSSVSSGAECLQDPVTAIESVCVAGHERVLQYTSMMPRLVRSPAFIDGSHSQITILYLIPWQLLPCSRR